MQNEIAAFSNEQAKSIKNICIYSLIISTFGLAFVDGRW